MAKEMSWLVVYLPLWKKIVVVNILKTIIPNHQPVIISSREMVIFWGFNQHKYGDSSKDFKHQNMEIYHIYVYIYI